LCSAFDASQLAPQPGLALPSLQLQAPLNVIQLLIRIQQVVGGALLV
jgi:hypothetical protein